MSETKLKNRIVDLLPGATPVRKKTGVAIIGFTDHREQAFKLDPNEFELWGLNELYRYVDIKKFDRWFEIHPRKVIDPDKAHIEGLGKIEGIPIYMQEHYDDIPMSRALPKDEIEKAIGESGDYQTSSISWMIGLALLEGFEKIHLYGIDMAQETEYSEQRPCVEFLLGIAQGRAVETYLPDESDILKAIGQYAYGFAGSGFNLKLQDRMDWLNKEEGGYKKALGDLEHQYQEKKGNLDGQYHEKKNQLTTSLLHVQGALQDCSYWKRSWAIPQASDTKGGPTPDRTKDPKTGITKEPETADEKPAVATV